MVISGTQHELFRFIYQFSLIFFLKFCKYFFKKRAEIKSSSSSRINEIRSLVGRVPLIALTATTATRLYNKFIYININNIFAK